MDSSPPTKIGSGPRTIVGGHFRFNSSASISHNEGTGSDVSSRADWIIKNIA
jgi:hypothetical protein